MKNIELINLSKSNHKKWKEINFKKKENFFPVFKDFEYFLNELSPGATSLFLYFGLHANYQTGECFHSIDTIANYFNKSKRTISNWIKELENKQLILRLQKKFNGPSHTLLLPYGKNLNKENLIFTSVISKDLPFN